MNGCRARDLQRTYKNMLTCMAGVFVFISKLMRANICCLLLVFSARALFILFRSIFHVLWFFLLPCQSVVRYKCCFRRFYIYELRSKNISNEIPVNGIGTVLRQATQTNEEEEEERD